MKHEIRECIVCKKTFKFYMSNLKRGAVGKFCSLICKGKKSRIKRTKKKCPTCLKKFEAPIEYKIKKYCSHKCYGISLNGSKKNSFWETASKKDQIIRLKKSYEKYVVKNKYGCWEWKGAPSKRYGSLQYGGKYKSIGAHVASYILHKGDIPNGLFVCHTCDNPRCTNPNHLFLGTPKDNVVDMIKKGRNKPTRSQAKLTEKQVLKIRQLIGKGEKIINVAKKFEVGYSTVYDISRYTTWKNI